MEDLATLLGSHGLTATVLPGSPSPLSGDGAGNAMHWKVAVADTGRIVFEYPIATVTEGPPEAPSITESLHFLREDCLSIVKWPADREWLEGHERTEGDDDWLAAKRDIESLSREMAESLPADFVQALVPGLSAVQASPSLV